MQKRGSRENLVRSSNESPQWGGVEFYDRGLTTLLSIPKLARDLNGDFSQFGSYCDLFLHCCSAYRYQKKIV